MAVSAAQLAERHPELADAPSTLVEAKLAEALRRIDTAVWGDLADDGQAALAAHLIAMSPFGTNAQLRAGAGANQTSIYFSTYEDLRRQVGTAHRVVDDYDPEVVL